MTATVQLTTDLQNLVLEVEDDLRDRLEADQQRHREWQDEHKQAVIARRTAMAWTSWRDDRIVQAAVSWVLTTVFVRFAEDNQLISRTWFTGPGAQRHHAVEAQQAFFRKHPEWTDREWIEDAFAYLRRIPATAGLVDAHAGLQLISPSGQMARRIIGFWRELDDNGALIHDLADSELSTRFLGDLYEDLSSHARETFALRQTPDFVEEFILDQTLTPALAERPLKGFKLIDPTCGSGHFLLGAFSRFNELWRQEAPDMDVHKRVQLALDSVYGVDINAFAVAVARFRLTIAAMQASGEQSLEAGKGFNTHVETGDSLIHGKAPDMFEGFSDGTGNDLFSYATEDQSTLKHILRPGQYDVVVGNPPYITVQDKSLNERYRELYPMCKGKYALTVPFMERFFDLAKPQSSAVLAGWTGQITSNSFMKREFGINTVENFLANIDLRTVVDTSGAAIPGHGTPTVILVGRNDQPQLDTVRAVLRRRGEPRQPANPAHGLVWASISKHTDHPGYEDEFITVIELDRRVLAKHPWSLQGGAVPEVMANIVDSTVDNLRSRIAGKIGFASFPGSDEAFIGPRGELERTVRQRQLIRPVVTGDIIRNWGERDGIWAFSPYDESHELIDLDQKSSWYRRQWPLRTSLGGVVGFGGETQASAGKPWWGWYRWIKRRYEVSLSITFAFVETHNHFVLDRGGKVFKQSAPVIKLPQGATEEEHLKLLGLLNSSVACFWLKQKSHNKGAGGGSSKGEKWRDFYEFTGTTLMDFPLPESLSIELPQRLDDYAQRMADCSPTSVVARGTPSRDILDEARAEEEKIRGHMVFLQEELDWFYYQALGFVDDNLNFFGSAQLIRVGGRPFEEVLREEVAATGESTRWFSDFAEVDELDIGNSDEYERIVSQRLKNIRNNRMIRLLETPEYKRTWAIEPWIIREERALRSWLLDGVEAREIWFDKQGRPTMRSIAELADILGRDQNFISILDLWIGKRDTDPVTTLTKLLSDEVVPYLAAWRLKASGLRKWDAWNTTWNLQRREDAGEEVGPIPVPPKYTRADFTKQTYWSHRGKLDVPKERFILYPDAELSTDHSMLLGWAGWNHAEQFIALATHMNKMTEDGAKDDKLLPVLAGLYELTPWVQQWHAEIDPGYGVSLGDFSVAQVEQRRANLGVSFDDLKDWRPPQTTRHRRTAR